MQCPDCGGPMWDNRQTKKNPKQPDYKCKNKACDKAVWLKAKGEQGEASGAVQGGGNGRTPRPLGPLYFQCMTIAAESCKRLVPGSQPADIIAATATLFIGATNTGAPLRSAPPAPKPKPAPEPEPEDDPYSDDSSLPF